MISRELAASVVFTTSRLTSPPLSNPSTSITNGVRDAVRALRAPEPAVSCMPDRPSRYRWLGGPPVLIVLPGLPGAAGMAGLSGRTGLAGSTGPAGRSVRGLRTGLAGRRVPDSWPVLGLVAGPGLVSRRAEACSVLVLPGAITSVLIGARPSFD